MSIAAAIEHRLTAEARGQARLFRGRMIHQHTAWASAVNLLRRSAIGRVRQRRRQLRPDDEVDITRAWRSISSTGQLCPLIVIRERHRFQISDLRCIPETLRKVDGDWAEDDNEPALVLGLFCLSVERSTATMRTVALASVSLHALGRRYERSRVTSDCAVMADLLRLANYAKDNLGASPGRFVVSLDADACWLGERSDFVTADGQNHPLVHHARMYWAD